MDLALVVRAAKKSQATDVSTRRVSKRGKIEYNQTKGIVIQALPGCGKTFVMNNFDRVFDTDDWYRSTDKELKSRQRKLVDSHIIDRKSNDFGRVAIETVNNLLQLNFLIVTNYYLTDFVSDKYDYFKVGFKVDDYVRALEFRGRTDLLEKFDRKTLESWATAYADADYLLEYDQFLDSVIKV